MKIRKIFFICVLAISALAILAPVINFFYGGTPKLCYSNGFEIEEDILAPEIKSGLTDNIGIAERLFLIKKNTTLDRFIQTKAYYLTNENSAIVVLDKMGNIKALSGKTEYIVDPVDIGDTFSPIVFSAICSANPELIKENPVFCCTGSCAVKDRKLDCTANYGHGEMNFIDSENHKDYFACRCNQMMLSLRYLDCQSLSEYCEKTGVFKELNIDGLTIKAGEMKSDDFNCIGNSVKMSLMQLCRYYSAICGGGKVCSSRLFESNKESQTAVIPDPGTADIISRSYLNYLCPESLKAESKTAVTNYSETNNSSIAIMSDGEYTVVYFINSGNLKSDALNRCGEMISFCKSFYKK